MMGYAPLWSEVCESVYALYPVNENGDPLIHQTLIEFSDRKKKRVIEKLPYGSAFAVSSDGLFMTASHVLDCIRKTFGNIDFKFGLHCVPGYFRPQTKFIVDRIVKEWPKDEQDVALLKCNVQKPIKFLKVRTGGLIESPGQPAAAFGYPRNIMENREITIIQRTTWGVISAIPKYEGFSSYEVDTVFNQGISGGPLVSIRQKDVIGVVHGTEFFETRGFFHAGHLSIARIPTHMDNDENSIGKELEKLGVPKNHFNLSKKIVFKQNSEK